MCNKFGLQLATTSFVFIVSGKVSVRLHNVQLQNRFQHSSGNLQQLHKYLNAFSLTKSSKRVLHTDCMWIKVHSITSAHNYLFFFCNSLQTSLQNVHTAHSCHSYFTYKLAPDEVTMKSFCGLMHLSLLQLVPQNRTHFLAFSLSINMLCIQMLLQYSEMKKH